MKGLFIIIIYLCINLVVAVDYDPIEETLQSIGNQLVQEDENSYETENIFPRSINIECLQSAVSTLKETAKKLEDEINELEQYINSESAVSEPCPPEPDKCESESSSSQNSTTMEVPMPMEAYGYANANETTSKECECNENDKLKTWDKQISVCKEILHNSNKNLMEMISDLYPEGHKRTIKIKTKHRKSKSNYGKRSGTVWSEWTNWSPCSVSCGAGQQVRFRKCIGPDCNADLELDERQCFQPICSLILPKILDNFQSLFEQP